MNARYEEACRRFEAAHAEDPQHVEVDGARVPWSVHYHRRMARWLDVLAPEASEPLRLAVRCQHLRRWTVPRADYPTGLTGYKRWRSELARRHAAEASALLRDVGYEPAEIERVGDLLTKKGLRTDPETQLLEDAACLVFLENQLADFAVRHPDDKVIDILRKTWRKMSPAGHAAALGLINDLPRPVADLIRRALS